jgi:tRNA threonylcarbamoyladenosine biosynthesis protein TsaB
MSMANMTILAIDTSTRRVGIALYDGSQVVNESSWISHDYHTVELAPAVASALEKSGLQPADLRAVAVATGPGSFTGLRVGLAFAKGLSLALRLQFIGIPTLDIVAAAQPVVQKHLVAVLRAGRGRLAAGWYSPNSNIWSGIEKVETLTIMELSKRIHEPTIICGELTSEERSFLVSQGQNIILASPSQSLRRASYLAELAWQRFQANQVDDPAVLTPFYLHYNEPIPG